MANTTADKTPISLANLARNNDKMKEYIQGEIDKIPNSTVDDTLSDTSTNPVQGNVIKQAIDNKADKTVATTSADGLMSAADKTKLDGVEEGANKTLIDTELSSTSKNPVQNKVINAALNNKADITAIPTSLPANDVYDWAKQPTKPTYTASEVGADASGSANTALTEAKAYTDTEIAGLINGAPTTLDTLGEIADAMKSNQTVVEALNTAIGTKANTSDLTAHTGNTSSPHSVTKTQVGLGNVPNVTTNDQTPSYTVSSSLTKLTSGEKLSVAFGKISKAITDLISHIGDSVIHTALVELTQAEYNALSDDEKNNGTVYYITDISTDISNAQQSIVDYTSEITLSSNVKNLWSTSIKKLGHIVNFVINITVNEYSGNSITFGTLPEAVRPNGSVSLNAFTNSGTFCYLFVDSDGRFGATKLSGSWSNNDGVRFCFSYIVN